MADRSAPPDAALCIRCGGAVLHDATSGELRCERCGVRTAPAAAAGVPRHAVEAALARAASGHLRELGPEVQTVACERCGAVTATDHLATQCPFCDGALLAEPPAAAEHLPDAVAPFSIDEATAQSVLGRWLARRWFAPSDLARAAVADRLQGVYLPFWSFSLTATAVYSGERGEVTVRREPMVRPFGRITYREVRNVKWRRKHGHVRTALRDHLIAASTSLPGELLDRLGPWPRGELVPFAREHLRGFLAERYRIDLASAYALAQAHAMDELTAAARADLGGDQQRVLNLSTKLEDATFRLVMLPVWSTALRYRGQVHRVVLNGQTGKLVGSRPWSRGKLAAAALVAAIMAALAWWALARRAPAPPEPAPEPTLLARVLR